MLGYRQVMALHRRGARVPRARMFAIVGAGQLALLLAAGAAQADQESAHESTSESSPLQEIVVTATRHEESLSKVPISVTALTQDAMDVRGIKDILDVARFTPGINIDNSGTNNIAIRGIASTGGAGTTGIYLDDTPIQMRALAFNSDEPPAARLHVPAADLRLHLHLSQQVSDAGCGGRSAAAA